MANKSWNQPSEKEIEQARHAMQENQLTDKQSEIFDAAQYASARAKEKYGYFGDTVENYNMLTQSGSISQQVSQLKDGWQSVIPQIGGVLRDKFGIQSRAQGKF